jgi:DNA-binding NarL/FixJ family response regulator
LEGKVAKVFIIDQQSLFREGIRSTLAGVPDLEVSGESEVGERALSALELSPPEVVLLGTDTAFVDGIRLCRLIKQRLPSVAVVMLAPQLEDEQLFEAIKAQASACLSKETTGQQLVEAIARCARGEHPINDALGNRPRVAERVLQQFYDLAKEKEIAEVTSPLTPREMEILNNMAEGLLNKQIADVLSVTEQTIKNHITSILRKLNANARTQAVVIAIKKGLVTISREEE